MKTKRTIFIHIILCIMIITLLAACSDKTSNNELTKTNTDNSSITSTNDSNSSKSTYTSFTNEYGTSTTKCNHAGCSNYIASSGDTNCCTIHSNKCLNCKKYIDEDAMYCMDCLKSSVSKNSSSSSSNSYSSSTAGASGKCQYKEGGQYVCSNSATNGSYCKKHYDYLNDAYDSLFGN